MKYYFQLQFRMINRKMTDFGINPAIGYTLILLAFIGFSLVLFQKIDFAGYIYSLAGIGLLPVLSERGRNRFLELCYPEVEYHKIRLIENLLVILPFFIFLIIMKAFIPALILMIFGAGFAFIRTGTVSGFSIPTPFGKKPFEFPTGFRSSFMMIFLALFLAVMSVSSGNFNLGIASLILVFLVCMSYYLNPENEFYVWIFNLSPGKFLLAKIRTALIFSTILTFPVLALIAGFFPGEILIIAAFQFLGYIYLLTMILAKYSSYPHQVNLPQFIILAISIWMPPILIVIIPFFYRQSIRRLKPLLG